MIETFSYPYGYAHCLKCDNRFSYDMSNWHCRQDNYKIQMLICPKCGNKITEFYICGAIWLK